MLVYQRVVITVGVGKIHQSLRLELLGRIECLCMPLQWQTHEGGSGRCQGHSEVWWCLQLAKCPIHPSQGQAWWPTGLWAQWSWQRRSWWSHKDWMHKASAGDVPTGSVSSLILVSLSAMSTFALRPTARFPPLPNQAWGKKFWQLTQTLGNFPILMLGWWFQPL